MITYFLEVIIMRNLVGMAGLEPAVAFGVEFTARWGYQFSYTPKEIKCDV